VGVREEALKRFADEHSGLVKRSAEFTPLSQKEREEIRRWGRELGRRTDLSLTAAARRIAGESGRATETVRRVLRRQQQEEPQTPFEQRRGPLEDDEKSRIYAAYQDRQSVGALCEKFERSRSSIYRIINEQRARELMADESVPDPSPHPESVSPEDEAKVLDPPEDADRQVNLFRLYSFLKASFARLKEELNPKRYVSTAQLDRIESRIQVVRAIRRHLLGRCLPVVFDAARKHAGPVVGLAELVDEGCRCVLGAIDRFDYLGRGGFQRYARLQLMKTFARTVPQENYQAMTPRPGPDGESTRRAERIDALACAATHLRSLEPEEIEEEEMKQVVKRFQLTPAPLTQVLQPVAETLDLDAPAVQTATEQSTPPT
jgi:DNA-directed RNA polymerase sigma subunit (sigma70/sigma32)